MSGSKSRIYLGIGFLRHVLVSSLASAFTTKFVRFLLLRGVAAAAHREVSLEKSGHSGASGRAARQLQTTNKFRYQPTNKFRWVHWALKEPPAASAAVRS